MRWATAPWRRPREYGPAGRERSGLVLQTDIKGAQRPFLSDFLAGITSAASAEFWTLTVATSAGGEEMLSALRRLANERKSDGFILPRTRFDDARVRLLRELDVPFVLFGRVGNPDRCAWFDILGEEAMRDAVLRLAAHGHRRIGFVNAAEEYNFSRLREEGFRAGMAQAALALDESLMVGEAMSREAGRDATRRLLGAALPPTAIVFAVDLAALGHMAPRSPQVSQSAATCRSSAMTAYRKAAGPARH